MKGSLIIIAFFIGGVCLGRWGDIPEWFVVDDFALYALYALMLLVGVGIGNDGTTLKSFRTQSWRIVCVPAGTIVGTLVGVAVVSVLLPSRSLSDCLAVGSGFGYYSLSSIFITQYKGTELGTVALVANVSREVLTLLFAPLMVRYFGKLAPISSGGATTMDTTLPVITRFSGKEFVVVAIFHGMTVDFCVPFLVSFFCLF